MEPSPIGFMGSVSSTHLSPKLIHSQLIPHRVEQNIVIMAACVPTLRPLFHKPWGRSKNGSGYSGPQSDDTSGKRSQAWPRGSTHQRVPSSTTGGGTQLDHLDDTPLDDIDYIGHKGFGERQRGSADSAESQQGIMLTTVVHVGSTHELNNHGEWPVRSTEEIVPQNLKDSER